MITAASSPFIPVRPTVAAAHSWVRRFARLGFVARGIFYLLVGLLTIWSVAQNGKHAHGGMTSTFDDIYSSRPGVLLLVGLAVGFAGFAVGMMWAAFFDWNSDGRSTLGLLRRGSTFFGGLGHISLMATAMLLIAGHEPEGHGTRRLAQNVLLYPFGREGICVAGLWAVGYGLFLLSKVWTGQVDGLLSLTSLPARNARIANWIGRLGMLSRGIIYVTIGVLLCVAGVEGSAQNVVGFGGAMRTVSENAFGAISLALIAAGLVAYGLFMFIEARYRRFGT